MIIKFNCTSSYPDVSVCWPRNNHSSFLFSKGMWFSSFNKWSSSSNWAGDNWSYILD